MLLLFGINGKVKPSGVIEDCACPACNRIVTLQLCNKHLSPHLFFIPTPIRFSSSYFATCPSCASVMELDKEKGRQIEKGQRPQVSPQDLRIVQNHHGPSCPRCGARVSPAQPYCAQCGEKL